MLYILITCAAAFILQSEALDSASERILKPCKAIDPLLKQCWLRKIEDLRSDLIKGIPELGLPPIDEFKIPRLTAGKRKSYLVSFDAQYRNVVFTGAKRFEILDININSEELVLKLKILIPVIYISGSFTIDGKLLGYRLLGDGRGEASLTNLVFDIVLDGEQYTKNGQEYIRWKEGSVEIIYDELHVHLYDILKDPELYVINNLIEYKIDAMRSTFTAFLDRTIGNSIIDAINRMHDAFPKNSLYPIY